MLPLPGPVPSMLARLLRVWWSSMRGNAHILQLAKGQESRGIDARVSSASRDVAGLGMPLFERGSEGENGTEESHP